MQTIETDTLMTSQVNELGSPVIPGKRLKVFFQFEIVINVLVSSFHFI